MLTLLVASLVFGLLIAATVWLAGCGTFCPDPPDTVESPDGYAYSLQKCWEEGGRTCCRYASVDQLCEQVACESEDSCRTFEAVSQRCDPDGDGHYEAVP